MTALDFARLREGEAGCPSDLVLDRLHAGELPEAESRQITVHVEGCATCPGRMAARQEGFAGFPEVDPRPLLSAIRRRLHESAPEPVGRRWLRQLGLIFAPVAAVTAALAVFMLVRHGGTPSGSTPPGGEDSAPYENRVKGALGLYVYRLSDGKTPQVQGTVSGDRFAPGDRLRFVVDLPSSGQVQIVGVESDGDLYVAWPGPGSDSVRTFRPAGKSQELPGAVALDTSPGRETLYLVHCAAASTPPSCTSQGVAKPPQCPPGCRLVPYLIDKVK